MNDMIMQIVSRLLVGSFFTFWAQSIAGKGSIAEPVRLVCACFMTLLLLSVPVNGEWSVKALSEWIRTTEEDIRLEIQTAQSTLSYQMKKEIDDQLSSVLQKNGLICSVHLTYDDSGQVSRAEVYEAESPMEDIIFHLTTYTGLSEENIFFISEESDANR